MRVRVERDRCMGHAMCEALAGEVFEVSDEGLNEMGEFEVGPEHAAAARKGAVACPERAITIIDEE